MQVQDQPAAATAAPWRPRSVPERLALAGLAAAPVAAAYPTLASATGLGLVCPLRAVTGVPCPLCGGTTAATHLAAGRLGEAAAANPLVPVLAVLTLAMAVVMVLRWRRRLPPARPLSPAAARALGVALVAAGAAAWTFQFTRFGLL